MGEQHGGGEESKGAVISISSSSEVQTFQFHSSPLPPPTTLFFTYVTAAIHALR